MDCAENDSFGREVLDLRARTLLGFRVFSLMGTCVRAARSKGVFAVEWFDAAEAAFFVFAGELLNASASLSKASVEI